MPLHENVLVSTGGIHGNCWFANDDIKEGTVVWWAGEYDKKPELRIPIETIKTWPKEKQEKFFSLAYMVEEGIYSGFPDESAIPFDILKENYVNHSCDGNTWYLDDDTLVAKRDIKKGEEIAYDYALTEADPEFVLNCRCGKACCRGTVTGFDWQKPELQAAYGNHFLPHINARIQKMKEQGK